MSGSDLISELPGGKEVVEWFGHIPGFHDAEILGINLMYGRRSTLLLHVWNILDSIDANGAYETDKHAVITVEFTDVRRIDLTEFDSEHIPIIITLKFMGTALRTVVTWNSSIGAEGSIEGYGVSLSLKSGKP